MEAPDLTKEELKKGKNNPCPLRWQKKGSGCPSQGSRVVYGGHHGGCQLAGYSCPVGDSTAPGYTASKENKG